MMKIADIIRNRPPMSPELEAIQKRTMEAIAAEYRRAAMVLEDQLLDFLCSGAMPRDLSLGQDRDTMRFDVEWRPTPPLRIR